MAQAAASRCSVGVSGPAWPGAASSGPSCSGAAWSAPGPLGWLASAVSALRSILLLAVSGRLARQWMADGTM